MTGNLFDNAKFGDIFLTTENKQAVFLRFAENAEYKFAILYVEGWGNVQVFRHNGKAIHDDAAHSIISKKEEPVSEELNTESMIESYKQRLISQANGMKNSPLIDMFLVSYKHGINETLDTLNLSNVQRTVKNRKELLSEGLEEEIEKCLKRHNMLAVGKKDFTDIAKHFTDWQKEQMLKNAIPIKIDSGGSCGPFNEEMWIQAILLSSKRINIGNKYKHMIIEVKED